MPKADPVMMWTIFNRPSDFPGGYIARLFEVHATSDGGSQPTGHTMTGELAFIRTWMDFQGLTCLTRSPEDDPTVVETWF